MGPKTTLFKWFSTGGRRRGGKNTHSVRSCSLSFLKKKVSVSNFECVWKYLPTIRNGSDAVRPHADGHGGGDGGTASLYAHVIIYARCLKRIEWRGNYGTGGKFNGPTVLVQVGLSVPIIIKTFAYCSTCCSNIIITLLSSYGMTREEMYDIFPYEREPMKRERKKKRNT